MAGAGAILFGAVLIIVALVDNLWILIYGVPMSVVGFFILFNKKEDEIEQIKESKQKEKE